MKYNANGQIILAPSQGTGSFNPDQALEFTDASSAGAGGTYAPDGSVNISIAGDETVFKGAYAPNGSRWVVGGAKQGWSPIGSWNTSGAIPQLFPFVSNFHKSNMQNWMTKYAATIAGTGRSRLVFLGDSTTLGIGSTSDTTNIALNARILGMPAQLGDKLVAASIPANYDEALGYQPTQTGFDPRITLGAGWAGTGVTSAGGNALIATATGTASTYSFGSTTFDRVQFWWYDTSATGIFEVLIDGVSQGNIVTNGAPNNLWKSTTYSTTLGTHTLSINFISGGNVHVHGPAVWKSGTPQIDIYNMGVGGSTAAGWDINNNWWYMTLSRALAGDLYVINLGINDLVSAHTTTVAYQAAIDDMVNLLVSQGANVIICVPTPCNNALFTSGINDYRTALRAISSKYDIPLIDWYKSFNEVYTPTNYWVNSASARDTLHPNAASYGLEADTMKSLLTNVFTL